jgi:hypothetical protein
MGRDLILLRSKLMVNRYRGQVGYLWRRALFAKKQNNTQNTRLFIRSILCHALIIEMQYVHVGMMNDIKDEEV